MGELFDRYVVVDWSAAARPVTGADSIWIAAVDTYDGWLVNPSTRRLAEQAILGLRDPVLRTLVAVDASFGYPSGTAAWFGLDRDEPWRAMWAHVAAHLDDDDANANDRFAVAAALNRRRGGAGPFWGCPRGREIPGLVARKPASHPLPEFRSVEQRLRAAGRRPASAWQLLGAGSVGSQTLTLLPILHRLVAAGSFGGTVEVWPFTTGLTAPSVGPGTLVLAECWPTAFDLDLSTHAVRDAAQVDGVARQLQLADTTGELASWLAPDVTADERRAAESEEGWVLLPSR